MTSYDFDFAVVGANDDGSLMLGGDECPVSIAADYWVLQQIKDMTAWSDNPVAGMVEVPLAVLSTCVAFAYIQDDATRQWLALDCLIHPTTIAYTLAHAQELGFAVDEHDEPREWVSSLSFAQDLGGFANLHRMGDDPSPWVLYPGDIVTIPNAPTAPPHQWIDHLTVRASVSGWVHLHTLLYPISPHLGLNQTPRYDIDANTVAHVLRAAAEASFPIRYAGSPALAVAQLLELAVPHQLRVLSLDVADRLDFIDVAARWSKPADRVGVVCFGIFFAMPLGREVP